MRKTEPINSKQPTSAAELRRWVEERQYLQNPHSDTPRSAHETERLLHELRAHQIVLRMQNEELQKAREESERLKERFSDLYDFAPIGFVSLSQDGAITQINLAGAHLLDKERSWLNGKRFESFIIPADQAVFNIFLHQLFTTGAQQACEVVLTGKGMQLRTVQIDATLSPDGMECRAVVTDISERKQMEATLQNASSEWRRTFDSIPDLITIIDLDHRIVRANRATWQALGCDRKNLIGQPCYTMFHGCEAAPGFCPHSRLLADGLAHSSEVFEPRLNRYFDVTVSPFYNLDGKIIGSIHVAHDITLRKLAEADAHRKNLEIEQFIYTVSHDLRSPLVTVKTFLGYLEEDLSPSDSERVNKDLEFIHSAADRMEALLNELLDMARIGRASNPHETTTFHQLVTEAVDAVAGQISSANVMVQISMVDLILHGDRRRLLQIWQNLLDNAVKYRGEQTSPLIQIGVEELQGETIFYVRDNGIGIAPAYHEKVFNIFEQLDRQNSGVGMGLTMVRRIVELYGGRIQVESAGEGQGCCFRFTLPEAVAPTQEDV